MTNLMDFTTYDISALHITLRSFQDHCDSLLLAMQEDDTNNNKDIDGRLQHFLEVHKLVFDEIERRQLEKLLFSVEDVFRIVGQFDLYAIFKFYASSEAYLKYGEEVHGNILYNRKARLKLSESIAAVDHERNDGLIYLDIKGKNEEKVKALKKEGFLASDIYSLSFFNNEFKENAFKKEGLKEIPNTIPIQFQSGDFDLPRMENLITSWKLQDGKKVLDHELMRYYANEFIINQGDIEKDLKQRYLFEPNENMFKEDALIQIYSFYHHHQALDGESKKVFNLLLKNRATRRFELLKNDLGINDRQLLKFKLGYPHQYKEVHGTFLTFRDETLSNRSTDFPIFWDEERFVHIYGRHYVDYFRPYSTYKGTKFQYTYKDIRRVVCLILENLRDEIEMSLMLGNPFNKYGDQGYYFNGDYYTLRINEAGRLMTFFPMSK